MSDNIQIVAEVPGSGNGMVNFMNDGHIYFCHHETQSAKYFRCRKYRDGCPGRVIFYSNGFNSITSAHSHDVDAVSQLWYQANGPSVLHQAINSSTASFGNIFNDPR